MSVWFSSFLWVWMTAQAGQGRTKLAVCHVPPGNPSAAHTIWVGERALRAHLDHGDQQGECSPDTTLQSSTPTRSKRGRGGR